MARPAANPATAKGDYGQGGYGQAGYGQGGNGQTGYGQNAPPAYAQQGWAGGMQQTAQAGDPSQGGPPPETAPRGNGGGEHMDMAARFRMANTTNDGRLTLAQAQAGRMGGVVRHFQQIDRDQKGYVTLQDVRAWHHAMHAQKMQGQAGGQSQPGGPYPPPSQDGQQY